MKETSRGWEARAFIICIKSGVEGRVWWMCGGCVSWRIDRIGRSESVRACVDGLNAGVGGGRGEGLGVEGCVVCGSVCGWVSEGVSV